MNALETEPVVLETERRSPEVHDFEAKLRAKVVGQSEAVDQLVGVYQTVQAGLPIPGRPLANLLFLGPTGTGKTLLVEAAAEILLGSPRAIVKIDCAEFQQPHEIARLVGSPPGYIGHRETQPALTQDILDRYQTEHLRMSFVLFDEIEKASDALWELLLGVLDKGTLTLGDNRKVDFSRTVVFLTSNLGASEMSRLVTGGIGFAPGPKDFGAEQSKKINRIAVEAAKRRFSPEFMNRIDKVVVFQRLSHDQLQQILDLELSKVQDRINASAPGNSFVLNYTDAARSFLIHEGTDPTYGARHLKRAVERHVIFPLSSLMSTDQLGRGDTVKVDMSQDNTKFVFLKTHKDIEAEIGYEAPPPLLELTQVPDGRVIFSASRCHSQ